MIQLRIRTEYSFGQTFAPIPRIIERLKATGCTAAGIVDPSTWGHVPWFQACREAGIQPLLGVELAVSDEPEGTSPKMWFLASGEAGLREMYQTTSKASRTPILGRFGGVPRLYRADVERLSPGVLRFAGEIVDGPWLKAIGAHLDLSPASRVLNARKLAMAREFGLPVVAVSDNAFAFPEDGSTYELASKGGLKPSPQYILPELEHQDVAAAIAEQCSVELPHAPMIHYSGNLEQLCRAGIEFRKLNWNAEYEQRLQHELKTIRDKDFESYFLVISDMMHYAKQQMLVGPSRGSSAGSLVCYLTRITEIDPIPPKLMFERFIDASRSDLPDVDADFNDKKRHLVFEYMAEKYGQHNVAKIGTIATYAPKSALIKVCQALNIPPAATAALKVAMIERGMADSRANNCLEDTLNTTDPGKAFIKAYPQAAAASLLEGHASHTGTHAAGLLICNEPITNYCTVDKDGIAHLEKNAAETLGLLKIDVLGLRTLGILEDSGVPIDWYGLPLNDPKVLNIFNEGRLSCIFQFEGQALQSLSKNIKFESMVEIDAITALARPGPFGAGIVQEYLNRKAGKKYETIHPLVEAAMSETMGLPLYQEQTMAIVRNIGKFGWDETSFIRRAISKRMGKEFFNKFWTTFKEGAASQGIDEVAALKVWELINSMGAWQMNKSHTYSYAVISYWTAYLKAYHPLEFAAANLRNAKDADSAVVLLREMAAEGIQYKAFDLELSEENWSAKNGMLIGGFTSLHGVGDAKAAQLVAARNAGTLTDKQKQDLSERANAFADIFPMRTKYGKLYDDPKANGINDQVWKIADLDGSQEGSHVFLGEVIYKNMRNANEEVNVKKRGGKLETGPLEFIDVRMRDDTGMILARVGRYDFQRMGKELAEKVEEGAHLMIRANFKKGFRFGFIQKWKRIDDSTSTKLTATGEQKYVSYASLSSAQKSSVVGMLKAGKKPIAISELFKIPVAEIEALL